MTIYGSRTSVYNNVATVLFQQSVPLVDNQGSNFTTWDYRRQHRKFAVYSSVSESYFF